MGKARFFSVATAAVVVLNLGVVTASGADAAQGRGNNDLCVAVSGGTVLNETVLDVVADGGTAIGDVSGGNGNLALTANGGNENATDNGNNGNGNNNHDDNGNHNKNRNDWSAQPLDVLEQRLMQTDTASSGNGGVADVAANGGAVSIQDINSGGNAGNAISIGDTSCSGAAYAPAAGGGGYGGGGNAGGNYNTGGGGRGGQVRALPSTGVGELGSGTSSSLMLALGALGMMGLSLGS